MASTIPRPNLLAILVTMLFAGCSTSALIDSVTGGNLRQEIRAQVFRPRLWFWRSGHGNPSERRSLVEFRLELHAEGRASWQAITRELISILDLPRIQPGAILGASLPARRSPSSSPGLGRRESLLPEGGAGVPYRPSVQAELHRAAGDRAHPGGGQRAGIEAQSRLRENEPGRHDQPLRVGPRRPRFQRCPRLDSSGLSPAIGTPGTMPSLSFAAYPELRGEIHELFDQIRLTSDEARLGVEAAEKEILETWALVEAATDR